MDVTLLVYDLSGGLARQMSMGLLGFQLDAVYHTSVELGGREYVYDGGIVAIVPGSSHLGQPMERVPLGTTTHTMAEVEAHIDSLRPKFTAEAYDLFRHNCNHFSDAFSHFLVGRGIPEHIATMPERVLQAPLGQMLMGQLAAGANAGHSNGGSLLGLAQSSQTVPATHTTNTATRHLHETLPLPSFAWTSGPPAPILYAKVPPLDKLAAKMGPDVAAQPAIQALQTFLANRASATHPDGVPLPDLSGLGQAMEDATASMPRDALFAVVDLVRCSLADARVGAFFADEAGHTTVCAVLGAGSVADTSTDSSTSTEASPYALRLVTLQAACNLFAAPQWSAVLAGANTVRAQLVQLVAAGFLDEGHTSVRVAAASLLFNIAVAARQRRILSEDEQVELAAAVVEAIGQEVASADALRGMLLALGHLVYGAPLDGALADLLRALDASGTVLGQRATPVGAREPLVAEVGEQLLGKGLP